MTTNEKTIVSLADITELAVQQKAWFENKLSKVAQQSGKKIHIVSISNTTVTTDTTKGVSPYNASYGYTNITINDVEENSIEDLMLLVECTGSLVVAGATRNIRIRFGNNGEWIPVYYGTSIASGSTYFTNGSQRLLHYSTNVVATGAFYVLTDKDTTYTPASLSSGYGTCTTAEATVAKVASLSSYALTAGGHVSVKFDYAVPANATLNINNKGAKSIYYQGSAIAANIIKSGNIALFVYDGTNYNLISIDGGSIDTIGDLSEVNSAIQGDTIVESVNNLYDKIPAAQTLPSLGCGYGTCTTAATTTAKVGTLANYVLTTGGIVSIKFTYAVPANATLNINSKGAKYIYYNGAKITANVIGAGNIATFMYDGTQYHVISVNKEISSSSDTTPESLGFGYGTCSTASSTAAKVVTLSNYNLVKNGIVVVNFTYAITGNATLNINGKGAKAIYVNGTNISAGIINAGNIATFMYDGTNYVLLGIVPRGGTVTSTTPTITASGGDWICSASAITKLTINTITKNASETNIFFKTGTTFSLSVPASTKFIGDINFDASTEYVISIKFGVMVVRKVEGQTS